VAISVAWVVNGSAVTSAATASLYTIPSASTAPYGAYARDLVVTNGGPSTVFLSMGTGTTGSATTSSFLLPSGGTLLVTQCQLTASALIGAVTPGTASVSIGYATNVSYI
jgi:hypothetical protein